RPDGRRTLVMVIGVEHAYLGSLPDVTQAATANGLSDSALVLDASDARTLDYDGGLRIAQIASRRGYFIDETTGFASFIGSPMVFTSYVDAHRYLRLDRTQVSFIVLHVTPGRDPTTVRDALRARFP